MKHGRGLLRNRMRWWPQGSLPLEHPIAATCGYRTVYPSPYCVNNVDNKSVRVYIYIYMVVSINGSTPKWSVYRGKTLWKLMIWGNPHFRKASYMHISLISLGSDNPHNWSLRNTSVEPGLSENWQMGIRHGIRQRPSRANLGIHPEKRKKELFTYWKKMENVNRFQFFRWFKHVQTIYFHGETITCPRKVRDFKWFESVHWVSHPSSDKSLKWNKKCYVFCSSCLLRPP